MLSCLSKYPSFRQILSTGVACLIRRQGDERNERRFSGGKNHLWLGRCRQPGNPSGWNRFCKSAGKNRVLLAARPISGNRSFLSDFLRCGVFSGMGEGPGRGECSAFAVVYKGFHIYSGDTAAVHGGYVLECGVDGLQHVFRFSCFRVFPANQFFQGNAASVVVFHDGSRFGDGRGGICLLYTSDAADD